MTMLDVALSYAARGWRVFPCHTMTYKPEPGGAMGAACSCGRKCETPAKHPRIKTWQKAASSDAKQVQEWWLKWPDANIAIATGPDSDLTVIDLDGPQGLQELEQLRQGRQELSTLVAQTGSGAHLYYLSSGERSSAKGKVHVRGAGGYVIAPPSLHHSGRRYRWLNEGADVLELPDWLAAYASEGQAPRTRDAAAVFQGLGPVPAHLAAMTGTLRGVDAAVARAERGIASRALANLAPEWTAHEELRLRSAVMSLGKDVGYDGFLRVGMALKALDWERSDGTSVGFDIWDQWCAKFPEFYNPAQLEYKWTTFGGRSSYGPAVSIATIYKLAQNAGWDARSDFSSSTQNVNGTNGHAVLAQVAPQFTFGNMAGQAIIFPDVDKSGRPKPTCQNTRAALRFLGLTCTHDTFHDRFHVGGAPVGEWAGELTDNAVHAIRSAVFQRFRFDPGTVAAYDAAIQEGLAHAFDPVQDYLDGLKWDGVPRLGAWLRDYLGADDTPLNAAIGKLALVAAVRRAREPGTKFDQIVVLEGREGTQKSSAIEVLASAAGPGNYSDSTILTLDDRGQQEAVQGVWIYEIADLTGIGKAEIERVKAFASRTVDRARPAYGRSRQDKPRRCIFFATTNHDTYLKSQTGNRRFWPVRTGTIDLGRLQADRDQLWAEACTIEEQGGTLQLPMALWVDAAEVQDSRREHDPWDDDLAHIKAKEYPASDGHGMELRITTRDVFDVYLKLASERKTDISGKRLAYSMRRLGWDGPAVMWIDGAARRGYRKRVTD